MTNRWLMGAAAAALTVAGAISAQAADLPTRKAPPVFVPPPFTWTGFYVGVNGGGVWSTGTRSVTLFDPNFPFLSSFFPGNLGTSPSGWLLGGQAGYNWQTGAFVVGAETDFDWTDLNKNFTFASGRFANVNGVVIPVIRGVRLLGDQLFVNAKANLDWLGTTRLRLGFVATPDNRLMFYGTGGVAYAGGSSNFNFFDANNGFFWGGSPSSSRVGWTVGAGAEYAFTDNITAKFEYLYYNLGSSNAVTVGNALALAAFPGVFATEKLTYDGSIVRAGINYKF